MTTSEIVADPGILERNLGMIAVRSPDAAARIRETAPSDAALFVETGDGTPALLFDGVAQCSKRHPVKEAESWARGIDPHGAAFFGVMGFGAGHHLAALSAAHKHKSVIVCCEPDVALLRAVLERIDHSGWMGRAPFVLITDPGDRASLSHAMKGLEGLMAAGVRLVDHPPSVRRVGEGSGRFGRTLIDVVGTTRTHVVTLLAHAGVTMRNFLMNLDHYTTCAGIAPLEGSCAGRPAILVAAGPSLAKNLHLLEDPRVRERGVIIAVQTMLKPLLARGIRPHFVTALDHDEISRRFYEGLTREDVEGVRLVVEPKANAAIADAFPGEVVCAREAQLDLLLGEGLARPMGAIRAGSTVAHLNYYLARHLGCETVILVGQDLGFSDALYYGAGAAIHSVWGAELSEHRSLETLEFERVMRMRSNLRERTDVNGNPMYSDEQMTAYIAQFEADFKRDTADRGVRVIDASEGGARIAHTEVTTLREALDAHLGDARVRIPDLAGHRVDDAEHARRVRRRVAHVSTQLAEIEKHSERTIGLLERAIALRGDAAGVDRIVKKIHKIRDQVHELEPALALVGYINQKGGLSRFRTDREIALSEELGPEERQTRQLERDRENVRGVKDAARQVRRLLERTDAVLAGTATKITRREEADASDSSGAPGRVGAGSRPAVRVECVVFADPELGPLGTRRDLGAPIMGGDNALVRTLERLAMCRSIDGVRVVTPEPDRIAALIEGPSARRVTIESCDAGPLRARTRAVGLARSASRACWRGSLAGMTCYDESLDPVALARVMGACSIDAAVLVGAEWSLVDPSLVDRAASVFRGDPAHNDLVFSQAAPGLGGCLVSARIASNLGERALAGGVLSSIGSLIAYNPREPRADAIASPQCLPIGTAVRDAGVRVTADTDHGRRAVASVRRALGDRIDTAPATEVADRFAGASRSARRAGPGRVVLELCTGRLSSGVIGRSRRSGMEIDERPLVSLGRARGLIRECVGLREDCTLLIAGSGDPLMRPDALDFVSLGDELGVSCVELRTDLLSAHHDADSIIDSGLGVLSVDVLADTRETYERMTGIDRFESVLDRMQSVFDARGVGQGVIPTPWIVPRMTKCDESVGDLRAFTDRWLTVCGVAVIDPLERPIAGSRIAPLPVPSPWDERLGEDVLRVRCDGSVIDHDGCVREDINAFEAGVEHAMRAVRRTGDAGAIEPKPERANVDDGAAA